jgi:hypothetical protein
MTWLAGRLTLISLLFKLNRQRQVVPTMSAAWTASGPGWTVAMQGPRRQQAEDNAEASGEVE